jgi:hypothetical protein
MAAGSRVATAPASTRARIRMWIIEALAQVRVMSPDELTQEIDEEGDEFEIDSKEAEVVLCILEHRLGQELARPEDLRPEQLTTLDALIDLVSRRYVAE